MSTGASNDFARATTIARSMVMRYGMSDALGIMVYVDTEQDNGFRKPIAEETQQKVDAEIRRILDEQYALSRKLLSENREKVEMMTKALLEWETIDADQVNDIMAGNEPRAPKDTRLTKRSSPGTPPSDIKPNAPAPV
jgi:cell division protease FtsH